MNDDKLLKALNILLVEDNPGDILLIKKALKKSNIQVDLNVANDGSEALIYLKNLKPGCANSMPNLILLDLNLPETSGHEVLKVVKSDDNLQSIPIVVVTTSQDQDDINDCYKNHANCYLTKPLDVNEYFRMIDAITNFWGDTVNLPPN